jgi:hypothetical protein
VAHAGVFERLQELLLDELGQAGALDWSRVSLDSFSQRATRGDQVGANPVDRAKPGFKLHLAVEGGGLPLSLLVTRANTNDSLMFEGCWTTSRRCAPQPASGAAGHRRFTPDKAYDHRHCRGYLTRRGIKVRIAVRSSRLTGWAATAGRRTHDRLAAGCRRLRIRYDRDPERFFAFVLLAGDRLCYNRLPCAATARSP